MHMRILSFLISFLFGSAMLAQHTTSGTIVDAASGEPLIGVAVQELNTANGTVTDIDGSFSLETTQSPATLDISYLGYLSIQQEYSGLDNSIYLKADAVTLDEVVVTGPLTKRQKRELGYSTERIDGVDILASNAPNVVNALSGRSAGVIVANANGVDGGTTRITIRGNNNIKGNNQPLIIVDGVPLENDPGLTDIGRGRDWGSAINMINPEDIADINILKGPTAAAKYGTRGANGVILITTKRGTQQEGLGIQYAFTQKWIDPYRYRDVQNTYGAGGPISLLAPSFETNSDGEFIYPQSVHSSNGPKGRPTTEQFGFYSTGMSWGPEMMGQSVRWWDGELREYSPQPNNLEQFFRTGQTQTHNISFSKGFDNSSVRVSLTATDHDAVIPNSEFQQYTANLGSRLQLSDKLTADIAANFVNFHRKNSPSLGDDNNSSFAKGILYSWPRSYKGLEETINFNEDGTRSEYNGQYPFTYTPQHLWWNTYHQNRFLDRNKFLASIGLTYQAFDWLQIAGRVGIDFNVNEFEERHDPVDLGGLNGGFYANELQRDKVINRELLATIGKDDWFSKRFDVRLSLGGAQWDRSQYGIKASASDWQNPWLFTFNNYGDIVESALPSEIRYDKKINSVFGFLNVDWDNYLFLELSGRNDWSSALPLENNAYFYPSASISYIVTESFDIPWDWLSFWKIRGSVAQTASDTDPFLLDFVYNTGIFSGQQTANLPATKPPVTLKPQIANSFEAGTTLGMFYDKLNLDFTYYYIKSFDQILDSPVPTSSGVSQVRINSGVLENYGFELGARGILVQRPSFFLETGLNISRNRNFVLSLGEGAKTLELANIWGLFGPNISVQEGQDYGTIYGYDYVYHENGQAILNDEGTHYRISENLVPVGNASPDFIGGWTLKGRYKQFNFSNLIDAKIGGDVYAGSYVIGLQTGQSPETLFERNGNGLPYTDPEGNESNIGVILPGVYDNGQENTQVVHYYYKYLPNAGGWGQLLTTPGILRNDWVKWRELSVSYTIATKQLEALRLFEGLELSIVGRDLFYIYASLPDRINPEGTNGSGNAQGLEWASLPGMRSFSFRIAAKL